MTYDAREKSADQGRPVELYTFNRDYIAWRFTSADSDRVVDFQTYKAAPIKRGAIEQGAEMNRSALRLQVPLDFPIAQLYAIAPPSDTISLTLRQYHEGDGELATIWSGRVLGVKFEGAMAEISLEPLGTSIRRNGLRIAYQKNCPKVLYQCGVNRTAFRVIGTAAEVTATTVQCAAAAAEDDGYFTGGYIEWPVATNVYDRRFIVDHVGATLTLDVPPVGLAVGAPLNLYPGCDHTLTTCHNKFGNALEYGGMPYIPQKNPMGSDPIY